MKNWSDDETLWRAMAPALESPGRFTAADSDAAAIVAAVPLPPGASVLDLGCGAGVHAVAFAARGCVVTAVDRSPTLLALAREHARRRSLHIELLQEDMRDFIRESAYDLACSLYSSFGYFDDETNRRVLRNVYQSLGSGGMLVLDLFGRENIDHWWLQRAAHEIGGSEYSVERKLTDGRSRLVENWTVTARDVRDQFTTVQRIYTATEMEGELQRAGFSKAQLFGSLDAATPYGQTARRLVVHARK
jgi:SAM-dependent methyltransferase